MRPRHLLIPTLLLLAAPLALARCTTEDDCHYQTEAPRPSDSPSGGSASTSGSDAQTEYGANTWAYAAAQWTAHDTAKQTYSGVQYAHSCSASTGYCYEYDGCKGDCGGYRAITWAYWHSTNDASDSEASVGAYS